MAAEAAFGRAGFIFVAANMFLMAYGAMLSYLMIVKDLYSTILHVAMDDFPMKRAILFIVSVCIILPVSCQRVSLPQYLL
jgi:solute carrier family 38 (sodium-coupled neutral amino acid transporter), member 11